MFEWLTNILKYKDDSDYLFDTYGTTYLNSLKEEILQRDKTIKRLENSIESLQAKIDTCVLVFEEYFAKDQTDDDLLVLAYEHLLSISNLNIEGFYKNEDLKRVLLRGMSRIRLDLQGLNHKEGKTNDN